MLGRADRREQLDEAGATAAGAPSLLHGMDVSCLRHLVGYLLAQADIPLKRAFVQHIGEPFTLRPVEFTVLALVAHNPGMTGKQLAQVLAVAPPNITLVLDKMTEKGLLERVRSETDRRAQNIHLTPGGRALAERALAVSHTMEREALRHLSEGERVMLLELLHKVARGPRA
jgi:DNA-binding MarR family transcriptional regulator